MNDEHMEEEARGLVGLANLGKDFFTSGWIHYDKIVLVLVKAAEEFEMAKIY